jgi:hypothetical protein
MNGQFLAFYIPKDYMKKQRIHEQTTFNRTEDINQWTTFNSFVPPSKEMSLPSIEKSPHP